MASMLMDAYGYSKRNIIFLRDDLTGMPSIEPTRANILRTLAGLVADSGKMTELIIHYSGHGTFVRDTDGDEQDGNDEAIVPCDVLSSPDGGGVITDDELFSILRNVRCKTILLFDSCHSGSVCDLEWSISSNGVRRQENRNRRIASNPNIVCISGCRDDDYSAESYSVWMGRPVGAFTTAWIDVLRENNHTGNILKYFAETCRKLAQNGYPQTPVLSSSGSNPALSFQR